MIANNPVEIELKLEYDDADRERLIAAVAAVSAPASTDQLLSTYFDTPGHDIANAGYSLRVRHQGAERIQTVKAVRPASAGLFERPEWEHPLAGDLPRFEERSGPMVEAVGADVLHRIEPVFTVDVRRMLFRLDRADAAIEIAIDDGEVRAGGRVEPLCEIELELVRGTPQAMFDLARALNEQVPLRLGVRSKAERGYRLVAGAALAAIKAEPIALDSRGDAAAAFQVIALSCIRQFRLNEAFLQHSGDAEAVHQARVGLRRLRSAFSLYTPLLIGDRWGEMLRAELRWIAAELGEVRNIDVLMVRYDGNVRDRLAAARAMACDRLRSELATSRMRLLMIDLAAWLAHGAWRTAPTEELHRQVAPFASDLLEARRDRLVRRGKGLARLDRVHRHRVRIEAKKLRYAAEFFGSSLVSDKEHRRYGRFLKSLEALQDVLGELNDIEVGHDVLARLGIDVKLPGSGKHSRKRLLDRAEEHYDKWMRVKRFW